VSLAGTRFARGPSGDHTVCAPVLTHALLIAVRTTDIAHDVQRHLLQRPGGQGVAGSNPVSPTSVLKPLMRTKVLVSGFFMDACRSTKIALVDLVVTGVVTDPM
jgi:hypothetical protein